MSTTAERPRLATILNRVDQDIENQLGKNVELEMSKAAAEIDLKRSQRDQRYAIAVNGVTQARLHSGRDPLITSPEDAAIINSIFSLLQRVADQPVPAPDKIFSNIPKNTISSSLEFAIATCTNHQSGAESRPSSEPPASTENSGE